MIETRKYSRDSLDRFGDDLFQELLRYVSLSDCFAFECASKQFRRSLFSGHRVLTTKTLALEVFRPTNRYSKKEINKTALECALIKCASIDEIVIDDYYYRIDDQIIDIIRDNCFRLETLAFNSFVFRVSPKTWQLFGAKFGHSLRRISFVCDYHFNRNKESIQTLLRLMPNLIDCETFYLNDLIFDANESANILPKLKRVSAQFDGDSDFHSFADLYAHRIESLELTNYIKFYRINSLFEQLSRFRRLQVLRVKSITLAKNVFKNIGLDLIASNCHELRELYIDSDSTILEQTSALFGSLRRLTLCYPIHVDHVFIELNHFSCCPNLTAFSIATNDRRVLIGHFADIRLYLPKLRRFELICDELFADHWLESLALLNELRYVKVDVEVVSANDIELRNFIINCESIRKINFKSVTSISRQTIEAFISRAKLSSKCYNYYLRTVFVNRDESIGEHEIKVITTNLPNNIDINIAHYIDKNDFIV